MVHSIPQQLADWSEGCPCHQDCMFERSRAKRQRLLCFAYSFDVSSCWMKGKRLAELCAGELVAVLQRLCEQSFGLLMTQVETFMPPESWAKVQEYVEIAKSFLIAICTVKFDWTRRHPWRLAVMAHFDEDLARRLTKAMVEEFDAEPVAAQRAHHLKTRFFLQKDGPLRSLVDRFIGGDALSTLPCLEFHVATLLFVNIVERFIEASHSIVQRSSATNTSGAIVSLARRLPQLEDRIHRNPSFLVSLLEMFEIARRVAKLPTELGVADHPVFHVCSAHQMPSGDVVKHLRKIMYRADVEGQYLDVTDAAKHHKYHGRRQIKQDEACIKGAYGEVHAAEVSQDEVWKHMFLQHFRHVLAGCGANHYFTARLGAQDDMSSSITAAMHPAFGRPSQVCAPLGFVSDVDDTDLYADSRALVPIGDRISCFRVVKANPSAWHVVSMSRASGRRLAEDDIVVSKHSIISSNSEDHMEVASSANFAADPVGVMKNLFSELPVDDTISSLTMWESTKQLGYSLSEFTSLGDNAEVQNVLASLIAKRAIKDIEGGGVLSIADSDQRNVLEGMREAGFVSKEEPTNDRRLHSKVGEWCLTSLGAASLQCSRILAAPKSVASLYRDVPAVEDVTAFEMATRLREDGWAWRRLPKKLSDRPALAYQEHSAKVWYSLSHDVDKYYLACLFNAGVIFELGLSSIDHGRPLKYYKCLMAGDLEGAARAWWVKRAALQLDVQVEQIPLLVVEDFVPPAAVRPAALVDDDVEATHQSL